MTSQRILSGSITRGSKAINLGVEGDTSGSVDYGMRERTEGWTSQFRDQNVFLRKYLKSNADDLIYINEKPLPENFDDTIHSSFSSNIEGDYIFVNGGIKTYLNHRYQKLDLGQSGLEDNLPFELHTDPTDPVEIIKTNPFDVYLPATLVDHSSATEMNGVLDPFDTRRKLSRAELEVPFSLRGPRGSLSEEDVFRRSLTFAEGFDLDENKSKPYLDSIEFFGPVTLPQFFETETVKLKPFTDTSHYREIYFSESEKKGVSVSDEMRAIIKEKSFDTSDAKPRDVYGSTGFDYIEGSVDSIAFGGLKK